MNAVIEQHNEVTVTPMQMLQHAMSQGADLDRLQQLMDLQERWEKNQARKAFVAAMAAFKAEPNEILKTKQVNIPGGAKFAHATLANVCDGVVANLSKHGLSHKWELSQDDKGMISVTCVLTHEDGHSEQVKLSAGADDSGKKNSIQQIASTITYLERYTLMAACGLSAKDQDDDGRGAAPKPPEPKPEGYEAWHADMSALAEEGSEKLAAAWGKSEGAFRRYVVKFDEQWWNETKTKAKKADPS